MTFLLCLLLFYTFHESFVDEWVKNKKEKRMELGMKSEKERGEEFFILG